MKEKKPGNFHDRERQPENENLNIVGNNIRIKREELNLSRNKTAQIIGVSLSTLQSWEQGEREPSVTHIMLLAKTLQTTVSWLFGETNQPQAQEQAESDFIYVPRYNIEASAGQGVYCSNENIDFNLAISKNWINHYARTKNLDLSIITVKGDSMEGVLNDRDLILINHSDKEAHDGIYVLRIDDQLMVKQLQRLPDYKLHVISKNTDYSSFMIDLKNPPSDFAIIGRVVWFGRAI